MENAESQELVSIDVKYQIEQYRSMVQQTLTYVKDLKIESKTDAERALDIACDAINLYDKIESTRKAIVEPARKFTSEVNRLAKDFTKDLEDVRDTVVDGVEGWKAKTGGVAKLETQKATTLEKDEFSYDVTDMMMVPREYMIVDEARVKLAMKQGMRSIPGIQITTSKKTEMRRR